MMAANELYIAKYYVKRSAHVAAIERIKYLLVHYNGTPSTEEGLLILIESYKYLKMNDLATDTARVLKENYPDYTVMNKNGIVTVKKKIKVVKKIETQKDNGSSWFDFLNIYNYF
jgi:outer membrane protein assembly factor BamD